MDQECKTCPYLCKRLESEEEPVSHEFARLTVRDVVELLPAILTEHEHWRLDILPKQSGNNHDLELLFKPKEKNSQDAWLTVNAEDKTSGGACLTFKYQVPDKCREYSPFVTELTELVRHSVDVLSYTDRLLRP
jgi:hypothetical protein